MLESKGSAATGRAAKSETRGESNAGHGFVFRVHDMDPEDTEFVDEDAEWIALYDVLGAEVELFAVLIGYLDDSAAADTKDVVSVGGWVMRVRHFKPFSRQWSRLHKGHPFHLTDFDAWVNGKRLPPWDTLSEAERVELRQAQNDLIAEFAVAIVGQSLDLRGLNPHVPTLEAHKVSPDAFDPYGSCFRACMKGIADLSERGYIPRGRVALVLEADTVHEPMGHRIFADTKATYEWARIFTTMAFQDKGPRPLEAADIVATEAMKEGRLQYIGSSNQTRPRASVRDLMRKMDRPVVWGWYKKETLDELAAEVKERFGLA